MPRLARGPKGTLLMVGLRGGEAGKRLCVLEYDAGSFRERADFRPIFEETPLTSNVGPTYAVSPSGREVVCGGEPDTCVEAGPGLAPRTLSAEAGATIDSAWQDRFPAVFGGETLWNVRGVASPDGHVFAFGNRGLLHWVGGETRLVSTPFDKPLHVWAASERDVWVADKDHLARFDGSRWVGVLEARGRMFGSGSDDLWALDDGALWHITPDPRAKPDVVGFAAPAPPPVPGSVALPVGASDSAYHLERAQIDIDGARPLRTATGIANVPGGGLWFYEGSRVVEQDGKIARVIHEAPAPKPFQCWVPADEDQEFRYRCSPRRPFPAKCQQCVAPRKLGEGAVLSDREWHAVHAGVSAPLGVQLTQVTAMAASPSGAIWAVSADQDRQPGALIQTPDTSRFLRGLPPAVYEGIGIRADDDVWLSGGLTYGDVGDVGETYGPSWEATGEGTLVHFDGHTFTRHRGPEGTLLAVAAVGPNEAWAVGLFGGVVHVKDGVSEAYHLERGGAPLRVTLRAVSASGPDDVWIAGDESTLLHWNGKALSAVDPGPLGRRAAFMGVTPPRTEAGWLVGPAGLWRIARTPQAPQQKL